MSAPLTPVEMLDWLQHHALLRPAQAAELRPLLSTYPDVRVLARELIDRDWLTPYEVNQILTGKGDQLILGCYRLCERLGEGAMGQVFKARNTRLHTVVAVKMLHKELVANPRAMDRFRQEIEAASQLDHPNIVKLRDADEIDNQPFMVMDYIDAVNLSYRVKTQGALPVHLAADAARQTALGLQHAFERGVVHRDVKPANLLIESPCGSAAAAGGICVKILDFGLARFDSERRTAARLTQLGSTLGTVDYMAPEQAKSARDADTRSDIYALGCSLYFLLTARPPFPGASVAEKIAPRLTGEPPSVRAVRSDVPKGLDAVLRRMMVRQPADRYQTPAEAAAALEPYTRAQRPAAVVPRMQLDEPIPVAVPIAPASAQATPAPTLGPPQTSASAARQAKPSADDVLSPPSEDSFAAGRSPFGLPSGSARASTTTPRTAANAGKRELDRRLVVAMGAGGAAFFLVLIGCGGCAMLNWMSGDGTHDPNAYPPGAELQIIAVDVSSDVLPIGSRKNVIVRTRQNFHGDVELRLEGLPPGVTSSKTLLKAGSVGVEVPIIASFGIEPIELDIRVVGTAKNLRAEKTYRLKVVAAKPPRGP